MKMLRVNRIAWLILVCFALFITPVYSQDFRIRKATDDLFTFYDARVVIPKVDSLINSKCKDIVVLQTEFPFEYLKSDDSVLTFVCWKSGSQFMVQIISSKIIYSAFSFNGESIFTYSKSRLALSTQEEKNKLKIVPGLINKNALFYFYGQGAGYFELPDNNNTVPVTYIPDPSKEKIRNDWFYQVYQILYSAHFNFKVLTNYDRYQEDPVLK